MELGSFKLLHPHEELHISGTAAYDDSTAVVVCKERPDLDLDYYYAVKP